MPGRTALTLIVVAGVVAGTTGCGDDGTKPAAPLGSTIPGVKETVGLAGLEKQGSESWQWALAPVATMRLANETGGRARYELTAVLGAAGHSRPRVTVRFPSGASRTYTATQVGARFRRSFDLPAKGGEIRFSTSAPPVRTPPDKRKLYFQVRDFMISQVD